MSVPDFQLTAGLDVDITGGGGQLLAVAVEGHAPERCLMPEQAKLFLARPGIPDAHAQIVAARGKGLPVRAAGHVRNGVAMPDQLKELVAAYHIPDSNLVS